MYNEINIVDDFIETDCITNAFSNEWDEVFNIKPLSSLRGYLYQYIYSLKLMNEMLNSFIDGYAYENHEDYIAWKNKKDIIERIDLIQVKSSTVKCALNSQYKDALEKLCHNSKQVIERFETNNITCRIVYNKPSYCKQDNCNDCIKKIKSDENFNYFENENINVRFDRYLTLPIQKKTFTGELLFINKYSNTKVIDFISNEFEYFLKIFLGFIIPFHSERIIRNDSKDDNLKYSIISKLIYNKTDVKKVISESITATLNTIRSDYSNSSLKQKKQDARDEANKYLTTAIQKSSTQHSIFIEIGGVDASKELLTKLYILDNAKKFISIEDNHEVVFENGKYFLDIDNEGLFSLSEFVENDKYTHNNRVHLFISFLNFLKDMAKDGLRFNNFRANDDRYKYYYNVKFDENHIPSFYFCDLQSLDFASDYEIMIPAKWIQGRLVADVLRYIYYGSNDKEQCKKTLIFNEIWNDNIVLEISEWIEEKPIISIDELMEAAEEAFHDELEMWPIFFTSIDDQFFQDYLSCDKKNIFDSLKNFSFNKYILTESRHQNNIYYAIGQKSQIGFTPSGVNDLTNNLCSYSLYGTKRWQSHQRKDFKLAKIIITENNKKIVPVIILDSDLFKDPLSDRGIVKNLFNINKKKYKEFLIQLRKENEEKNYPQYLENECQAVETKRNQLRNLRKKNFTFKTMDESLNSILIAVSNTDALEEYLKKYNYNYNDKQRRIGLSIETKNELNVISCRIIKFFKKNDGIHINIERCSENEWPAEGRFIFKDVGAEAVVESDYRVVEAFSFNSDNTDNPVYFAWSILEPLIKDWKRSVNNELIGQCNNMVKKIKVEKDVSSIFDTDKALDAFMDLNNSDTDTHIVTGAAGMGKTYKVAEIICKILDKGVSRKLPWPPFRVLVVGYSNKAVEVIFEELTRMSDKYVFYRQYTENQKKMSIYNDQVSEELILNMKSISDKILSKLSEMNTESNSDDYYNAHKNVIENLKSQLDELQNTTIMRKIILPSHEKWRTNYAKKGASRIKKEIEHLKDIIQTQKESFNNYYENLIKKKVDVYNSAYELFSADVVLNTVDSVSKMPDIFFDYVIFEEASQINVIKTLKVLNYVIRSRGNNIKQPKILFSGDPKQLPPYTEFSEDIYNRQDNYSISILDRLIDSNKISKTILNKQRRMKIEIARLINSIFYSDEQWISVDQTKEKGLVVWVDTSETGCKSRKDEVSTSWSNKIEAKIISNLLNLKNIKSDNDVIIISPYSDQIQILSDILGNRARMVRTIDSCQGTTASTVILSVVVFTKFLMDSRRLNVALSRAKKQLFIVGNLNELHQKDNIEDYPHLTGLKKFFTKSQSPNPFFKTINGKKFLDD